MSKGITALGVAGITLCFAACNSVDVPSAYYESYAVALSDGAMSRGWIPTWLPRTASEIREVHNTDTNQSMLGFRFDGAEEFDDSSCIRVEPRDPPQPPFSVSWWPGDVPANGVTTHRHSFYVCDQGAAFLAVSAPLGEGFYWRP
jgi:hypothetical protein